MLCTINPIVKAKFTKFLNFFYKFKINIEFQTKLITLILSTKMLKAKKLDTKYPLIFPKELP